MNTTTKILMTFALVSIAAALVFAKPQEDRELILKIGFQPLSTLTEKIQDTSTSKNTKPAASLGLEYYQYLNNIFAIGIGATYDLPRNIYNDNRNASFMPLFASLKLRQPLHGLNNIFMFCSGRIGGSVPMLSNLGKNVTQKVELYYGSGIGVSINLIVLEAIYAVNNFSTSEKDISWVTKANCQTITLYAGFKFE